MYAFINVTFEYSFIMCVYVISPTIPAITVILVQTLFRPSLKIG